MALNAYYFGHIEGIGSGWVRPQLIVFLNATPETMLADDNGMLMIRIDEFAKEDPDVLGI